MASTERFIRETIKKAQEAHQNKAKYIWFFSITKEIKEFCKDYKISNPYSVKYIPELKDERVTEEQQRKMTEIIADSFPLFIFFDSVLYHVEFGLTEDATCFYPIGE